MSKKANTSGVALKSAKPGSEQIDQQIMRKTLESMVAFLRQLARSPYEEMIPINTTYDTTEYIDMWQALSMPITKYLNAANNQNYNGQDSIIKENLVKLAQSTKVKDRHLFLKEIAMKLLRTITFELAIKGFFMTRPTKERKNFSVVMGCKYFVRELYEELLEKKDSIRVHEDKKRLIVSIGAHKEIDSDILRNYVAFYDNESKIYTLDFPCQSAAKIVTLFADTLENKIKATL
jgi:hypothetical protein